jgi:hypothetical protein
MSHEHKLALEKIVAVCEKARQLPTKRQERIHDIALEALGLTKSQRQEEIERVRQASIQRAKDTRDRSMIRQTDHQAMETTA